MRLIDADALLRKICGESCGCEPDECGYIDEYRKERCKAGQYVETAPTVEPRLGRWKFVRYKTNPKIGNYHCSQCNWIAEPSSYCPHCGAKMEGETDEVD